MSSLPGGSPHPYIPATEADRARMLERIGVTSLEALFADLPEAALDPVIQLPRALTEPELIQLLTERAAANAAPARPNFLGAGAYRHAIPAVAAHLTARSEFVTAYTPYQPEISQGTLQSAFEYQSVVCELTGLDTSNTGLYDGASATAEACLLAARVTKRSAVALLEPIHPGTADVVGTYARGAGLRVDVLQLPGVGERRACLPGRPAAGLPRCHRGPRTAGGGAARRRDPPGDRRRSLRTGAAAGTGGCGCRHRHRRGAGPGGPPALRRTVAGAVRGSPEVPAPDARPHCRAHAGVAGAGQRCC